MGRTFFQTSMVDLYHVHNQLSVGLTPNLHLTEYLQTTP